MLPFAGVQVFHAGTATNESGDLIATGGRVLGVTALGADVEEAQRRAYQVLPPLHFLGYPCNAVLTGTWCEAGHFFEPR